MIHYRQKTFPNLHIASLSGKCLRYVDEAGKSSTRRETAQQAADAEKAAGRLSRTELPTAIWVVLFFSLASGTYAGRGHVLLAKRDNDRTIEIHDSEVHSGAREPYKSIAEVIEWLQEYDPEYLGWSTQCDGVVYAELLT